MSTQSLHRAIQFSNLILKGFYKGFRIRYNLFWCFTWILRYGPKDLTENYLCSIFCPTVYTESTENSLRSTHRLQRAIQTYAESTENNSLSTQSLHRALQTYTESTQSNSSLHRVYTEQCGPTQGLDRTIWGLHRVCTEQYRTTYSANTFCFNKASLSSKWLILNKVVWILKVLPHSSPQSSILA